MAILMLPEAHRKLSKKLVFDLNIDKLQLSSRIQEIKSTLKAKK